MERPVSGQVDPGGPVIEAQWKPTEKDIADARVTDFARFAERFGWDHSGWDSRTVVQANTDKVHVVVLFSRYDADDELIAQFDSLYIVTRVDSRWGIRSRSSFAP